MILKYRFKTNEYLQDVNCPVILLHGTNDQTVPYESSIMLSHLNPDK
jgi:dipeptidyl aminopeptidase/acylaminoacyl peptidase